MGTRPRRPPRLRPIAALALAAVLLGGPGCEPFAPRDPVISTGDGSQWERPISPGIIVQNLEIAFENGIFNDYRRALTEEFRFLPDESDRFAMDTTERPGEEVYEGWDREIESATAETIALGADSVAVFFDFFSDDSVEDGRRLLKYEYDLAVFTASEERHYLGEAWFRIEQQSDGEWYIQEWEDVRSVEGATSWGFLKGLARP